jgi:hypothetical protein
VAAAGTAMPGSPQAKPLPAAGPTTSPASSQIRVATTGYGRLRQKECTGRYRFSAR